MIKKISCPACNHILTAEGKPGEKRRLTCPNCGFMGKFTFPQDEHSRHIIEGNRIRPRGVTILAALQVIAVIILIAGLILLLPYVYDKSMEEIATEVFGFPILEFLVVYTLIMVPISLLLSYGLLSGREWARFASVLFQINSMTYSVISLNFLGTIIPIYIIYYLRKPHVKDYFHTEQGLEIPVRAVIIAGVSMLLIFNGYIAFTLNPILHDGIISKIPDSRYYGTWVNESQHIEITFYSNNSFFIANATDTYWGTWENGVDPWWILKLEWKEGEGRYAPFFFGSNRMRLVQESGKSGFFSVAEFKKKS